jgi:hypothetical protein
MPRRALDIGLLAIFILSVAAIFLAHEDPFAREALCAHIRFCPHVPKAWHKIIYDLAVGALVSLFFYWLVVRLPDYQRRQRLKRGLEKQYRSFRLDCIKIMMMAADGSYLAGVPETLLEQDKFRAYFKVYVTQDKERWHEFQNNINEYQLRELLTRMEIFRDELTFVLNNTDIPKDEPFEFLTRLSAVIYSMKDVSVGYDELKPLTGFLWNVFAGWDWSTGYRKEDIVKKMINQI